MQQPQATRSMPRRALVSSLLAGWFACCLSGCGEENPNVEEGVIVKGKILINDKPITAKNAPPGSGSGQVNLIPQGQENSDNPTYENTVINAQGEFTLTGNGKGIPPGEYRLAIIPPEAGGMPTAENKATSQDPIARTFSVKDTPITFTIPKDKIGQEHDLGTIELSKHLKK